MDKHQRTVLQRNHMQLAEDLLITDDFLGQCFQEELFDMALIEIIRAEKTHQQRAHKLLELLPRRGPEAFDTFVDIIDIKYPWLAKALQNSLNQERVKYRESRQEKQAKLDIEKVSNHRFITQKSCEEQSQLSCEIADLIERVESFTQKNFALHRKMSQSDKRAVEQFLSDQIKLEIQKHEKNRSDIYSKTGIPPHIKEWLLNTHIKFKVHIDCTSEQTISMDDIHTSYSINFEIIDKQIDTLLSRMQNLENQITSLYDLLGEKARKKSPATIVENIMHKYHDVERQMEKKQREIDDMSQENYELTILKKKILHDLQSKDVQLEVKSKQISTLQQENKVLQAENDRLTRINNQHTQKEKTLTELQIMVNKLQESLDCIKEENMDLKNKLEQKSPRFVSPRRQSYSKTVNNKTMKLKGANRKKFINR